MTAAHLDATLSALTVLASYFEDCPGFTAGPGRLLTAAEMGCERHGLPGSQAPAVTAIASFWIALATGCPPAGPGHDDAASQNLAGLPDDPWEQAAALHQAAQMLRGWLACLAPVAPPQPGRHRDGDDDPDWDDLDDDGRAWAGPDRFTVIPVGPDIPRYVLLICGFLNAYASRPRRRRRLAHPSAAPRTGRRSRS